MGKDTEELLNELKQTKELGEFLEENTAEFEELPLTELLTELLKKYDKNRSKKENVRYEKGAFNSCCNSNFICG